MTNWKVIDDIISGFELQHETNNVYNKVVLHQCCVCDKYKTYQGDYIDVHKALRYIFETSGHYDISHGYCPICLDFEVEKLRRIQELK